MTESFENDLYVQPSMSDAPVQSHVLEYELARKCTEELGRFRNATTDKGSAMVEIARLIGQSKECTGDKRARAIRAYFRILETDEQNHSTLESDSRYPIHGFEGTERFDTDDRSSDPSDVPETEAKETKRQKSQERSKGQKCRKSRDESSESEDVPNK
jgi:hypothetical protein